MHREEEPIQYIGRGKLLMQIKDLESQKEFEKVDVNAIDKEES